MSSPAGKLNTLLGLTKSLVLASQSPRRRELLTNVGFAFDVVKPDVDEESVPHSLPHDEYVVTLALMKARKGAAMVARPAIVIGSDTTVVLDGNVMNKPNDAAHAREMLRALSGRTHTVYTGLALVDGGREMTAVGRAEVSFRELGSDEIDAYVSGGSPMDKAGAYGIQDDQGAIFVRRIEGCYFTVVGLPVELLYTSLKTFTQASVD